MDVKDFIIPEQDFRGLYALGNNLAQENRRKQAEEQRVTQQKGVTTKALMDYADPKEHLAGTPTDPETIRRYGEMMKKGIDFINENKGVDQNQLLMYLAKDATELADYTTRAKVIKNKITQGLQGIPESSGYDKKALTEYAMKGAWYNPDGSVKNLNDINPDLDYVSLAVQDFPEMVTNNKGIDEYMKGIQKYTDTKELKKYNNRGGFERKKVEMTAPMGFVPEMDDKGVSTGAFVPEYEVATDDGEPILHEFDDGKGGKVKAPVRMVTNKEYKRLLGNSSGTADWLRGQIKTHLQDYKDADGKEIDINSPQADMIGRAIVYDELKSRAGGSMKEIVESKPTQIKVFAPRSGGSGSGSSSEVKINDVYQKIYDATQDPNTAINVGGQRIGTRMNALDSDAQEVVINFAKKLTGVPDLGNDEIFVNKNSNGDIEVYKVDETTGQPSLAPKNLIGVLPRVGVNLKAQPSVKEKRQVVAQGEKGSTQPKQLSTAERMRQAAANKK